MALATVAPLKAEVRLAQAISQFEADLSGEQKTSFRALRLRTQREPPGIKHVMQLTADIDRQTALKLGGGRCFGPRLTNVLQSVQQFAAIGDVLVGGSQNIIACGVWSVVRFALLSTVTVSSTLEKLSDTLMLAGRAAPRYERLALLYPRSRALQSYLSEYFLVLVHLCHKYFKFCQKRFLGKLVSAMGEPDASPYQSELDRWASCIKEEVAVLSVEEQRGRLKSLLRFSEAGSARQNFDARIRILERCSTYDYQTTWKQIRKLGNTSLLNHDAEYRKWKDTAQSCFLMCTGKLGAGKSVVLANMVNDLNLASRTADCPVAYFFCRDDIATSLLANTIIGSLARQLLLSIPNFPHAEALVDKITVDSHLKTVRDLLLDILPRDFKAYIVLDNLDSCEESQKLEVLDNLMALQQDFALPICLSLQLDAQAAQDIIPGPLVMTIPEENPDIASFITHELEHRIASGKLVMGDPSIIVEIHNALLGGAQGMFLWVALQIETLCSAKTDESIRKALEQLPKDLPETFGRILRKAEQPGENYQTRILEIITTACRPLTAWELQDALGVVEGDMDWNPSRQLNDVFSVLSSCGSLITVDEEDETVRLIHHSVKQFLLGGFQDSSGTLFTQQRAESSMAGIVLTYLNYGIFESQVSHDVLPRLDAKAIPPHIVNSMPLQKVTRDIALHLLRPRKKFKFQLGKALEQVKCQKASIDVQFPFQIYAKSFWQQHASHISVDQKLHRRLFLRILGKHDFRITTNNTDSSLLHHVIEQRDYDVASVLVSKGADLESKNKDGETPLICAAKLGDVRMIRILLLKGADINSRDNSGQTPLSWAMAQLHRDACLILLESGASTNEKYNTGETLLQRAVKTGDRMVVHQLVIMRDVNLEEEMPRSKQTALSLAAEQGRDAMVSMLLDVGANLESQDSQGWTPLMHAVNNSHESIAKLLISTGARFNHISLQGDTALSLAAKRGSLSFTRLFVEMGADRNAQDASGYTALMYAAQNGHIDVVELLIDRNVALECESVYGHSALALATMSGHDKVVKLLQWATCRDYIGDNCTKFLQE